jgi:GAF domain-containing protein
VIVEPIPETSEAVDEFGPFWDGGGDLLDHLRELAGLVRDIIPDCVGVSVATSEHGVTFTLVATETEIAALDAVQYLDGGPCVDGLENGKVVEMTDQDAFSEEGWHLFARATSASNIATTLTLPVLVDGKVTGTVNLYGASPGAFVGHHEPIAEIFNAWAPAAVANADLGFSTRQLAEQAPGILHEGMRLAVAVGIIADQHQIDVTAALGELRAAARRAGVSEADVARRIIAAATDPDHS